VLPIDDSIRKELIRRARNKNTRQARFTAAAPCDLRFGQVLTPESGAAFTEIGAWHFMADLLEQGHPCHQIVLEKPPGQIGYVIKTSGFPGCPKIYIKVTLSSNKINFRSFHDSEY
jgi:hypothetical protein